MNYRLLLAIFLVVGAVLLTVFFTAVTEKSVAALLEDLESAFLQEQPQLRLQKMQEVVQKRNYTMRILSCVCLQGDVDSLECLFLQMEKAVEAEDLMCAETLAVQTIAALTVCLTNEKLSLDDIF